MRLMTAAANQSADQGKISGYFSRAIALRLSAAALLALLSAPLMAQETFGDWHVMALDADTAVASTTNDSGVQLVKICYVSTQKCMWGILPNDTCDDGDQYPALINSGSGSQTTNLYCSGEKKVGQVLLFTEYSLMGKISANDDKVGIALGMRDGSFNVYRFSMAGSHEATDFAESAVVEAAKQSTATIQL
jgi:hypothetical protein